MTYFLNFNSYKVLLSVEVTEHVKTKLVIYDLTADLPNLMQEENIPYLESEPIVFDKSCFNYKYKTIYLHNLYELAKMKLDWLRRTEYESTVDYPTESKLDKFIKPELTN